MQTQQTGYRVVTADNEWLRKAIFCDGKSKCCNAWYDVIQEYNVSIQFKFLHVSGSDTVSILR